MSDQWDNADPEKSIIERNCTRGHGPMTHENGVWGLMGFTSLGKIKKSGDEKTRPALVENGMTFAVSVFRCPVCGMIELVDSEAHDVGA